MRKIDLRLAHIDVTRGSGRGRRSWYQLVGTGGWSNPPRSTGAVAGLGRSGP